MVAIVLLNVLILSLGTIAYLVVRAMPRVRDAYPSDRKGGVLERWLTSELPEKLDLAFNSFLAKSLRRVKIFVMKADNLLTYRLSRVKQPENGNGKTLDFKDVIGNKDQAGAEAQDPPASI